MDKRTYEVSIWTLQDDFITVLKYAHQENKGQIQQPKFKNNTDGTQNFSFSIPMYIYQRLERIENPIWHNTINGDIIEDLRKIKLIFNKDDQHEASHEKVYEFLITKVTESHENGELRCNVECEGLAFHELGKVGYKVSLSGDAFLDEYNDWAERQNVLTAVASISSSAEEVSDPEPFANLQYWVGKFLEPLPTGENAYINPRKWYYEIQMNWEGYSYCQARESNKVYEEEYSAAWKVGSNGKLEPEAIHQFEEKARLIDLEESNYYNLTQEIAEKFGIFCRYDYIHDANYHIIGRKVVFYNSFYQEQDGYLDITYPYSTSSVSREKDGAQVTTKLFVRPVNDNDSGDINIINVDANKSLEDYILNFDYLHKIKSISEEQYAAIDEFEANVRTINEEIDSINELIGAYSVDVPIYKAKQETLKNSINLDLERINESEQLKHSVTQNGVITVGEARPDTAILLDQEGNNELAESQRRYYIKLHQKGILIHGNEYGLINNEYPEGLKIYRTYSFIPIINQTNQQQESSLSDQIDGWRVVYDEAGNPTEIRDIPFYWTTPITLATATTENNTTPVSGDGDENISGTEGNESGSGTGENEATGGTTNNEETSSTTNETQTTVNTSRIVYLTYSYSPELYYKRITELWQAKAKQDQKDKVSVDLIVDKFNDVLKTLDNKLQNALARKAALIKEFEEMMGPALREGYWQPEDYKDYGDHYFDHFVSNYNNEGNPFYQTYAFQKYRWIYPDGGGDPVQHYYVESEAQPFPGSEDFIQFIWDTKPFDDELLSYYTIKATQERQYYPIYNLNHLETPIYDFIKKHIKDLTFGFYEAQIDNTLRLQQRTMFNIGSQMEFAFVKAAYDETGSQKVGGVDIENVTFLDVVIDGTTYKLPISYEAAPCLVLTGAKNLSMDTDALIDHLKTYAAHPILTSTDFYLDWMNAPNNKIIGSNGQYIYRDDNLPQLSYFDDRANLVRYIRQYAYKTDDNTVIPANTTGATITGKLVTGIVRNWYKIAISENEGEPTIEDLQDLIDPEEGSAELISEGDMAPEQVLFFLGNEFVLTAGVNEDEDDIISFIENNIETYASYQNFLYPNTIPTYVIENNSYRAFTNADLENENLVTYTLNSEPMLVYPRLQINSLKLKNNETDLILKMDDVLRERNNVKVTVLNNFEDYSVLERTGFAIPIMDKELSATEQAANTKRNPTTHQYSNITFENVWIDDKTTLDDLGNWVTGAKYYITIKPKIFFEAGIVHWDRFASQNRDGGKQVPTTLKPLNVYYVLSNADQAIYLDALEVAKENAFPKTSYTITPQFYTNDRIHSAYNLLAKIVHINDNDLHFENVTGYISGLELDLEHPENDSYEIQNYKTKFEDLFSTIFAQSQDMKKTAVAMDVAAAAFSVDGTLSNQVITNSLSNIGINFSYNDGYFKLSDTDGLIGTSAEGAISFKHNGIFAATDKVNEEWKWKPAITPHGISADLITEGQIDLSKLKIYSGNDIAFQINEDGIFAYKTLYDDVNYINEVYSDNVNVKNKLLEILQNKIADQQTTGVDGKQYVQLNKYGLSLVAEKDAEVIKADLAAVTDISTDDTTTYVTVHESEIRRVELNWRGLTMRNWNNEKVFYADADTGNLMISGTISSLGLRSLADSPLDIISDVPESSIRFGVDPADNDESSTIAPPDQWIKQSDVNIGQLTQDSEPEPDVSEKLHFYVTRNGEVMCQKLTANDITLDGGGNVLKTLAESLAVNNVIVSANDPVETQSRTLWIQVPTTQEAGGTPLSGDYTYTVAYGETHKHGRQYGKYEFYMLPFHCANIPASGISGTYNFSFEVSIYNIDNAVYYQINEGAQAAGGVKASGGSAAATSANPSDASNANISNWATATLIDNSREYVKKGGYYTVKGTVQLTFATATNASYINLYIPIYKSNASAEKKGTGRLEVTTFTGELAYVPPVVSGDNNNGNLELDDNPPTRIHECKIYYIE